MKTIASFFLISIILLSVTGLPPPPVGQPPTNIKNTPTSLTSTLPVTDWPSLIRVYGAWFIVPIVLGVILSIILTILFCLSCWRPQSLGGPPFKSKILLIVLYTLGFAIILAGCIIAWCYAPRFTSALDNIVASISSLENVDALTAQQMNTLPNDLARALIPSLNTTAINETTSSSIQLINETRSLLNEMNSTVVRLQSYYDNLRNLFTIENEIMPDIVTNSTEIPSPMDSVAFNFMDAESHLDTLDNEANNISPQDLSSVPLSSNDLNQGNSVLPNITLPPSVLQQLNLELSNILGLGGLTKLLQQTLTTFPLSLLTDPNTGRIYTIVICIIGATIVLAYLVWYIGLFPAFGKLHRVPLCWSAFIFVFLGIAIGLQLTVGTITDDFCGLKNNLVVNAADIAKQNALSSNQNNQAMGPLSIILSDPLRLVSCQGDQTLFSLYNISLNDLGVNFSDILNGTDIPTQLATNSSSLDLEAQNLEEQKQEMTTSIENYQSLSFRGILNNILVAFPNDTIGSEIHDTLDLIDGTLADLSNQVTNFGNLLDQITASRRQLASLSNSYTFPNADSLEGQITKSVGQCAWLGNFWRSAVEDSLCNQIPNTMLWVGWSFTVVAIVMILLTPVIIWSIGLKFIK